jgi:glyoxylase-like metal-dependent hydrolase (beta-lactamase superfamily II)
LRGAGDEQRRHVNIRTYLQNRHPSKEMCVRFASGDEVPMVFALAGCGFARCYIIAEDEGLLAVDVGSIGAAEDVERFIVHVLGRSPQEIQYIIATHFHIDHIGGIGRLLKKSGERTRVIFHPRVRAYLTGERTPARLKNWLTGLCPATLRSARYVRRWGHLHFESLSGLPLCGFRHVASLPYPAEKIQYLPKGAAFRQPLGFGSWDVLETPGHTEDSISLYCESSAELVCGDLILNFKKNGSGSLNRFCFNEEVLLQTYQNLCRSIAPRRIYPGHGEIISGTGNVLLKVRTFH